MNRTFSFSIVIACILVFSGCKKYPDPDVETLSNYSIGLIGNGQQAHIGTMLKDSIGIQVYDNKNTPFAVGFLVRFKIIAGNGSLLLDSVYTNSKGLGCTRWKLGTNINNQKVYAEVVEPSGKIIVGQTIQATGTGLVPWDTLQGYFNAQLVSVLPDYVHQTTFIIKDGQLYYYTGTDYTWAVCQSFVNLGYPKTMVTDNQGLVFVSTWSGEVYKTTDGGHSWTLCAKPDPSSPYFADLAITSNHILFAGTYTQRMYRSMDKAASWQKVDTLTSGYLTWVVACNDSVFVRPGLFKSTNQGKTWAKVGSDYSYWGGYSERDGNFIFISASPYSSWDLEIRSSANFLQSSALLKQVSSTYSPQRSYFYKIGSQLFYAQCYAGVYVSNNNKDFQLFWRCDNLTGFFVDHNNRFIATDSNHNLYYYNQL